MIKGMQKRQATNHKALVRSLESNEDIPYIGVISAASICMGR